MRGLSVSCPEKLWVSQSLPVSAWHTVLSWNRKCAQMHFLSGYGAWECDTEDNHLQHSHPGNSTCASSVRGSKISIPTGALQKRMELTSGAMIILVRFIFGAWLFYQLLVLWMCSVLLFILLFCFLISVCVVLQSFGRPETRARNSTSILTLSWCERRREWRWKWRSEFRWEFGTSSKTS